MIRDISLRALLIVSFLLTGLIPLMVLSLISLNSSKILLQEEAFRQLETIRNIKKVQITDYFNERLSDIIVLSDNPFIKNAYRDLREAFYSTGGTEDGKFSGYKNERFEAPDEYILIHNRYFRPLKNISFQYGYYDLFLMDSVSGDTVFTVKKESDFGIRISQVDSSLKDVWTKVVRTGSPALSDTRPYSPSGDVPAQFLAAPIINGSEISGVIAVQISIDSVGEIMRLRSGMWKTGDSFLVGQDKKMRSDSHNDSSGHSVLASFNGSVEENGVDTASSNSALSGETGKMEVRNFQSKEVLSAYAPVNILGVSWAILAEVEKKEIDNNISEVLNGKIVFLFLISLALVIFFAMIISLFLSKGINGTIHQIELLIKKVLKGDMKPRINPDNVAADFRGVVRSSNQLIDALEGEIAEKEKLEAHLQSSRKLRSIGALAGGIAHDFNNILTNMYTNCHIIKENSEMGHSASESFDELGKSIGAATDLVNQILTFSNNSLSKREVVNIAELIGEVLVLLKGSVPDNVSIKTDFYDPGLCTLGIRSQIIQIFLNLVLNASHSIGKESGCITISSQKVKNPCDSGESEGLFCRIKIADTGSGMSQDVMENIFQPFFSTKPSDEGSGLGLSIVHGIVMNSGGMIDVKSTIGKGTVFIIDLPLFQKKETSKKIKSAELTETDSVDLLFVDDDPDVCRSAARLISSMGINVVSAGDGEEALEIFKKEKDRFDLILTDFNMPGINGIEFQQKISEIRAGVPVILCTDKKNILKVKETYGISGFAEIIIKPYSGEKLRSAIRSVLKVFKQP